MSTSRIDRLAVTAFVLGLCFSSVARPGARSLKAEEPLRFERVPPTDASRTQSSFHLRHGFQMQLLAAEPLTTDPVAMVYDENGLAWVVEMSDYPYTDKSTDVPFKERTSDLPLGKVRILEDTDGDGLFDRSDIFAQDLSWPTGLALYRGGVFVAATPDIWYLQDTDGDRKADVRRKVFTGFRKFNVQAVMNNLIWGLDNKLYGAGSSNGGSIQNLTKPDAKAVTLSRNDFRFSPVTLDFELLSGGARFGNTFDDWGNRFVCNIRNPAQQVLLPSHYLARNPYLPVPAAVHDVAASGDTLPVYRTSPPEPWRAVRARRWATERDKSYPASETAAEGFFTSSSGVTVYRGAAYPSEFRNNLFLGEVAGNLIHRQTLEPDGVTFVARRADPHVEFVTSDDNWFRPVNFVNAPDGTLHVLDMYRETIEHPWSIPDDIKAQVDLESGRDRGRIYRLAPPNFRVPPPPRLGHATASELAGHLENPNAWWRETAQRLLFERQDRAAIGLLRTLLRESQSELARLHALWCLDGLTALEDDDLLIGLKDASAGVREHAVRLAESRLTTSEAILERVLTLAGDDAIRVRFQVAFSLGECLDPRAVAGLRRIAERDGADPWMRTALLSSLREQAGELLLELLSNRRVATDENLLPFSRQLAFLTGARADNESVTRVLRALIGLPAGAEARVIQTNVVVGMGDGLRRAKRNLTDYTARAGTAAQDWLNGLTAEAARIAVDSEQSETVRRNGVELLSYGNYDAAQIPLRKLLDPREPRELQLAAARALSAFDPPDLAAILFAPWNGYTPTLRAEILDQLLSRPPRIPAVLDAIEAGRVSATHVSSVRRVQLVTHSDPAIRNRADRLFGQEVIGNRADIIARYRSVLDLPGDPRRGQMVFERECIGCHRLGEKGHDLGPNLTTVRHRTPQEILVHILDPNREVGPNFVQYVVTTDDGRTFAGMIAEETATSITLKRAENATDTILRGNIEGIANTGKSLMPEGLELKVTPPEMADLVRYVLGR